jgi:hypothetical protein
VTVRRALVATVVPSAPLLVPALAGAAVAADASLRDLVLQSVRDLLRDAEDREPVTVIGDAPGSGRVQGTWDWSGLGVPVRGAAPGPALPLSLAIGAWLLDEVDPAQPRSYVGVHAGEDAQDCRRIGAELYGGPVVRLLVVGDGSARRSEKAPGHFDERAEAFDGQAERALRDGDPAALLALDAGLARELLAAGRAPWQVLAGAAAGLRISAELRGAQAPYGVGYLVGHWSGTAP